MLFINPMWDSEAQRIGMQQCTPLGYTLHVLSDLVGLGAMLLLIGTPVYLVYWAIVGTLQLRLLWLAAIPIAIAIVAKLLYRLSWWLAHRQSFQYDYEMRESSWVENGRRRVCKWNEVA